MFPKLPRNSTVVALELGRRNGVDMASPAKVEKGREGLSKVQKMASVIANRETVHNCEQFPVHRRGPIVFNNC